MPFTEEQKRRALLDNGYDPEKFDLDEQGYTIERQQAPPATAATEIQHVPPQTSAKGAFGRSFGAALAPTLAGLATSAATLGIAETATGVGAPVGIPTLAIAGLLGAGASWAASKGQEKLMPDSFKAQLAADAEQHPIAAGLGSLAPNLVAFRPNTPANLVKTVRGFIPGQIDDAARFAAKDAAINTGINLGVGAGMRTMEGGDVLDPSGVAWDAAGALAFGRARNNALTRKLKLHPGVDKVNLAELVDAAQQDQRPAFEPAAPEAPAPTLRTWDFDIHGREKEIKAARRVVDSELKGRTVDEATYESMLVDASDKLRGEGKLKATNPVVDKLTGELKARKEAENIAKEESKLEQERVAREEKLKKQFLSPEEAAVQNSALEQERIKAEGVAKDYFRAEEANQPKDLSSPRVPAPMSAEEYAAAVRSKQLREEVAAENAVIEAEQSRLREERLAAQEERLKRLEIETEQRRQEDLIRGQERLRQTAEDDRALTDTQTAIVAESKQQRIQDLNDAEYAKYLAMRREEKAAEQRRIQAQTVDNPAKSKLRSTPEWTGRTSESREEAPDITFKTSKGSTYVHYVDGTTIRNKSYHPEHGVADVGLKERSSATFYIKPSDINRLDIVQTRGKTFKDTVANVGQNHVGVVLTEGPEKGKLYKDTWVPYSKIPEVGLHPVEVWPDGSVHFGNVITEISGGNNAATEKSVKESSTVKSTNLASAEEQRRVDSRSQSLTKGFVDIFKNHFAPLHGNKITAGEAGPSVKGYTKNGESVYTPLATQDTLAHEDFGHPFIDRALADPRGKKIVGQLMAEIEASPDYIRWRDEAVATGTVDPSVKEYAAQLLGQRLAGDLAGPKYKTTETVKYQLNILKRELKRIFGRATQDDIAELVQNAYVNGSRMGGRANVATQESREDVPEVPFKSNIARMVQGMKQERFTKQQLEAEIRRNKSTMEEYDYRGLAKTLPDKLDKATVLKAVEEVSPKIERVNFTDKQRDTYDPFKNLGITREYVVDNYFTPESKKEFYDDPASWEGILVDIAKSVDASLKTGYIAQDKGVYALQILRDKGNAVAATALEKSRRDRFDYIKEHNEKLGIDAEKTYNDLLRNKEGLQYDPVSDTRFARYWTSNPNRSETTLRIPGADYVDRPRSKDHFSQDTFGWIRTSEGEAGGVPTKIGEEAQSDVTKDFRKRTARDEELMRRSNRANDLFTGPQDKLLAKTDQKQGESLLGFLSNVDKKGRQAERETLYDTPYLNSDRRLLLKQLILEAERDGFKKIAWTTGDEQAKRNGRDVIEGGRVEWEVDPKNTTYVPKITFKADGKWMAAVNTTELRGRVTGKNPDEVLLSGVGLKSKHASEILARIKRGETSGSYEAISGEGYKNIYDREDVKEARRLGLEPKLEEMSDGITRWTAEITPKASEEARYAFSRSDAPIVGSGLSRIRELGPGGKYLGDKLEANAQDQQLLNGRFRNPVAETLREFSNEDATKIDKLVSQEGGFIPPKFKKAVATIKSALLGTHDEQRARNLPVKYLDEKGNTKVRPPKDKPGYNPSVVGTHVYDQLINSPETSEAAALRKDFIDYFTAEFSEAKDPKAKAEERLQQMFPRKGGGVGVDYNAVRLAEGHGLPESWKEKNIANKWYRYLSKFSADLAYFKNLQSDPAVRQLLNINEDGKTVGVAPRADTLPDGTDIKHVNYESNPHVIGALHDAVGGRQLLPSQMLSYSKLANAVTLGPVGKLRDIASVMPIASEIAGPWEMIKALPKAVMGVADGIAKAKERGIINTRSATWHENLDNLDTLVDRAADTINHYTGAQKLEQIARGFSWALGRAIAEGNINNPTFVKKFGGKKDVESIADRITENIQGTYDFRGTPTWIRESSFGPLFALNRWSIERFNNWKRNVLDEARDGNLKPLLGNMFGVLLGSALIDELNETIRGKKPDHLSWSEWLALDGEDAPYKLAAALSTSSTTGVLGDIVYSAHQLASGKPPRGTGMPMLEIASNVSERLGQMVQAESLDFAQLAVQLAKDNIQIVRDLIPADPKADERRDVRIFKRVVEGKPTPFINANPFENAKEKELRDATPEEFAALLPKVVQEIVKTSRNPAKDIESLKRSLSRGDNSFVEDNKFYQMLVRLRGEGEARSRLIKYLGEKSLREAKGGVL